MPMDSFEKLIKITLLSAFSLLNAVDMIQTVTFLRLRIEGNLFAVNYPQLWFLLKIVLTFGLPLGLYLLDVYLETKEDDGFFSYLKGFVSLAYILIFFADIFFLALVLRNIAILRRL